MKLGSAGERLAVDTVIEVLAIPGPVAEIQQTVFDRSPSAGNEHSFRIFGVLGDDVDRSVDGIRSPNGAARSADGFDAFDVLEHGVLNLPINTGEERRINAATIDQHKYGSREGAAEPANAKRPGVRVNLSYLNPRRLTKNFWNAGGAGTP